MPVRVAIPKEIQPGEKRVAITPGVLERLSKKGVEVLIESGAGDGMFAHDDAYTSARILPDAASLYAEADVVFRVQPPTEEEIGMMREGTVLVSFLMPSRFPERVALLRDRKITSFAMELVPRISRAQGMDALSSQASVAGYNAALMAAIHNNHFFPMLTTAAGTIRPSTVLVIGAGVAGLQAIATARRLGAIVEAYDIRAAAKEQVESLGAKLIDIGMDAESMGGYARELTDEEKEQQKKILAEHVAKANAVISTASVPGRPAPVILTREMVEAMRPGCVIIDLAAENGGNCELTKPGESVCHGEVLVHGPLNVSSMMAGDASEMYAKNLFNFLDPMLEEGELKLNWEDKVIIESALTHEGVIRHEASRKNVEGATS